MKLLITGDLVLGPKYIPIVHGAYGGDCKNLERILEYISTMGHCCEMLIPGHGPICGLAAVQEQRDYLQALREGVSNSRRLGLNLEETKSSLQLEPFRNHIFYEFAHANNIESFWHEAETALRGTPPAE